MTEHVHSGYPRLERNADGVPIWNQGPYGMSTALAVASALGAIPERWPDDWPKDGILCPSCDVKVGVDLGNGPDRLAVYYEEEWPQ